MPQSTALLIRALAPSSALLSHACRALSTVRPTRLWRSFFYVPGDRPDRMEKVAGLPHKLDPTQFRSHVPDLVVLDCEDGVGLDRKLEARKSIASALSTTPGGLFSTLRERLHRTLVVRINAIDSGLEVADLETVLDASLQAIKEHGHDHWPGPDLICLPKVESADQLAWLADAIDKKLSKHVNPVPSLGLVAMIESCKAIIDLRGICERARLLKYPLVGIVFGSDDYCVSLGTDRSANNTELQYARQYVPVVARAFDLCSIDMVDIDFKDTDKLQINCELGARLGFDGKQTIHPNQLPTVNTAFSPPQARVDWYRAMLAEAKKHVGQVGDAVGAGAFSFHGKMIDRPTLRQAEHAVRMADLIEMN